MLNEFKKGDRVKISNPEGFHTFGDDVMTVSAVTRRKGGETIALMNEERITSGSKFPNFRIVVPEFRALGAGWTIEKI